MNTPGAKFSKTWDKLKYNLGIYFYMENYT